MKGSPVVTRNDVSVLRSKLLLARHLVGVERDVNTCARVSAVNLVLIIPAM